MPIMQCPTCGRGIEYQSKEELPFRPFCSQRCKLIDLHKWLNEEYRVSEERNEPSPLGEGQHNSAAPSEGAEE